MSVLTTTTSLFAQNTGTGGGFLVGIPCFGGIIGLLCFALWIWALVDAIQNPALDSNGRLIWVLVIIFLPFIGSILYLVIGRNK
ncbi:MAG: PLD nuclease N-terminal domain-containing protein [Tepidisphaeraceae bacterium]